jgi:Domain of unknown function (DUF4169)
MVDKPPPKTGVVNLRRARKERDRAAQQDAAQANRAKHGATKADKSLAAARTQKAARDLDAHKRDKDQDGSGSDS